MAIVYCDFYILNSTNGDVELCLYFNSWPPNNRIAFVDIFEFVQEMMFTNFIHPDIVEAFGVAFWKEYERIMK